MDRPRDPAFLKRKLRRRWVVSVGATVVMVALGVSVSRLEPALPAVAESTIWLGTVRRGPMVREIRGSGTLVPEEIRWITAASSGRVERIVLQPGASVEPGTVILELSNPDLRQQARNAELDWQTARANLANQQATIANARLSLQANLVDAQASFELAQTDLEMNTRLAEQGMVAAFSLRQKKVALDQAKNRVELVKRQLANADANEALQLAPAEAAVNQRRAEFDRISRQLADLQVRAAILGRLQAIVIEVGQQVGPGTNLARVSDPTRLKAEVRIAETQTRDLSVGLRANVDTRNGHVAGHVSRIDPASQGGTVGVDVTLDGPVPPGARPDQGIDATIELERVADALFVESPAVGQEHSTLTLFRVGPSGEALRTPVKVGRRSVQFVEVLEGLGEGDRVILSDMSQYDAFDRLKLN